MCKTKKLNVTTVTCGFKIHKSRNSNLIWNHFYMRFIKHHIFWRLGAPPSNVWGAFCLIGQRISMGDASPSNSANHRIESSCFSQHHEFRFPYTVMGQNWSALSENDILIQPHIKNICNIWVKCKKSPTCGKCILIILSFSPFQYQTKFMSGRRSEVVITQPNNMVSETLKGGSGSRG